MSESESQSRCTARRAVQRLYSARQHFVYSQSGTSKFSHRSTYLVTVVNDFSKNQGFNLLEAYEGFNQLYRFLSSKPLIIILYVCYPAFHLGAWNAHFATTAER